MKRSAVLLACLALLAAPPGAAAAEKLRLGYVRGDLHHLAAWVAAEKGFYRDEGLEIEVAPPFADGDAAAAAFAAKSVDVGYLGLAPGAEEAALHTGSLRAAALANAEGSAIVVRADSPANVLADLAGKSVAIPASPSLQEHLLQRAVEAAGIESGAVTTVVMKPADMLEALTAGEIGAFFAWEPLVAKAVAAGAGRVLLSSAEIWAGHPCCIVAVEGAVAKERPAAVQAFLRAHARATELLRANPGEAVRIAVQNTGLDEPTVRAALGAIAYHAELERAAVLEYVTYLTHGGHVSESRAEALARDFVDPAGLLSSEAP